MLRGLFTCFHLWVVRLFVRGRVGAVAPRTINAEKHHIMKILGQNLKNFRHAALLLAVALLQNCKKEAVNTPAAPQKPGMYALVNDTAFTAVTVTASLMYDEFEAAKNFTLTGTMGNKTIQLSAIQPNVAESADFQLGPASINFNTFSYYAQPAPGNTFTQQSVPSGRAIPGASIMITAIDTAKRLISGTFTFPSQDNVYDANGKLILTQNNQITKGVFNQVPYIYTPYLITPVGA
jgi:hypothetical protein